MLKQQIGNYQRLLETFQGIVEVEDVDVLQENANVDGRSPMGLLGKFGSESAKFFAREYLLDEDVKQAMEENYVYPHDLDFYATGTTTCSQIPLGKLLENGFNTGHGHMREPQDIKAAMALASIILQANQNMQHGGQAYPMFDYDLAPYVKKTVLKNKKFLQSLGFEDELDEKAWEMTERDTYQACEAFIHNSNSMHSRGGGQVPFISVNYGTDTSREGRMLTRNLLLATQGGLGNGETPIFPIQIFKVKKGTNFAVSEPNYDLFQLALETTSRRLFPNFAFVDAPFNYQYYKGTPESEICYMGCRTRVMANIHGEENAIARGNLSFTSINLVKIALTSEDIPTFFDKLDCYLALTVKQLLSRFQFQCKKQAQDFKFLYSQGIWRDGESLELGESVAQILKQGSLSAGFIGLAEALVVLIGEHHGQSKEALELGVNIIKHMRKRMDEATDKYQLNFSLIATPAEGLSGKFTGKDREDFGMIEGVTDRTYYTNSFHVPVHYKIKAIDKINIEAAFHELCNAGHITYVEIDGNASANIKALEMLVCGMAKAGIGYGSINHPVDTCGKCGYKGYIHHECPSCGTQEETNFIRIRRITGYLVGDMTKWNRAKQAEEKARVKHC